jgi:hypothetical protein
MNRDQFNRSEMFNTVAAYMQTNNSLWSATPAIVQTMTELTANITSIGNKMSKQQTPITGAADQKALVRAALEDKILEVANQLAALAAATHDMNLAGQAELTLSGLDRMPDDALEETGERIGALAQTNMAGLEPYGITVDDLDQLGGLTSDFHDVKTAPRTALAGRAAETNTLPDLLRDTTSLLRNRLDKQMTKFKKSNPVFFAGYQTARVIVDRGAAPASPTPPPAPPP